MEVKLTNDSIQLISSYLSPTSRLNLAAVDTQFFGICTKWRDVKTIVFDEDEVTLASSNFIHNYSHSTEQRTEKIDSRTPALRTALVLCPSLKRLIIQTRLTPGDVAVLNEDPSLITKLYISTENLIISKFPNFTKLRTLHIVANAHKELKIMNVVGPHVLKAAFPNTLRRICLTDVYLTDNLMKHMSTLANLISLDLIGCLVDTLAGAKLVPYFDNMKNLEELSLPPSMFSFTKANKGPIEMNLKKLRIEKIALYMDRFDEGTFQAQIQKMLPAKLKVLVLFGNVYPMKTWKRLKDIKTPMIIFGPNEAVATCPQENLTNINLISHLVRKPPYSTNEYSPRMHLNRDVAAEHLSWKFSLVDWQVNELSAAQEISDMRRRIDPQNHDRDIIFEGIHLRPPAIQMRNDAAAHDIMMNRRHGRGRGRRHNSAPHAHRTIHQPPGGVGRGGRLAGMPARGDRRRLGRDGARNGIANTPATAISWASSGNGTTNTTDSMRTQPPTPPVRTQTGAVLNRTIEDVSPIVNTAGSNWNTPTTTTGSTVNQGFIATPVSTIPQATVGTVATENTQTSTRSSSTSSSTTSSRSNSLEAGTNGRSRNEVTATPERIPTLLPAPPPAQLPVNPQGQGQGQAQGQAPAPADNEVDRGSRIEPTDEGMQMVAEFLAGMAEILLLPEEAGQPQPPPNQQNGNQAHGPGPGPPAQQNPPSQQAPVPPPRSSQAPSGQPQPPPPPPTPPQRM